MQEKLMPQKENQALLVTLEVKQIDTSDKSQIFIPPINKLIPFEDSSKN